MVDIKEALRAIALRDITSEHSRKFDELSLNSPEELKELIDEIINGFSNPYNAAKIAFLRFLILRGEL